MAVYGPLIASCVVAQKLSKSLLCTSRLRRSCILAASDNAMYEPLIASSVVT